MRIHLRADAINPWHTVFTVFMNGGNCGQLTMTTVEAATFHDFIESECIRTMTEFEATGEWQRVKTHALETARAKA